jgi:hypothetical protein
VAAAQGVAQELGIGEGADEGSATDRAEPAARGGAGRQVYGWAAGKRHRTGEVRHQNVGTDDDEPHR